MRIYAIIPARYKSTRFPGKPLHPIDGKPMIQHVYERACSCEGIEEVFVATDDQRIRTAVDGFGGKAVMTAPGHHSGSDRIAEAAQAHGLKNDDLIVNIQGDQPDFRSASVADLILPFKKAGSNIPMSTLKYRIRDPNEIEDPKVVKVVTDMDDWALFFSHSPIPYYRDTGSEPVFFKHLGFYAYPLRFLKQFASLPPGKLESAEKLEQLRALEYGYRIKVVETAYDSPEIDTLEDAEKLEKILARRSAQTA
jgi:3-deoxy-manno-octulosonate cytidylyltransferase (CMP-KDO synthetase)